MNPQKARAAVVFLAGQAELSALAVAVAEGKVDAARVAIAHAETAATNARAAHEANLRDLAAAEMAVQELGSMPDVAPPVGVGVGANNATIKIEEN